MIPEQVRKILKNTTFKGVATLVSGTAIAQLILIVFQLVLRRQYAPEVFGTFGVYMSIVGILVILSTLRYDLAVVLPKHDKTANSLLVAGVLLSLTINIFLFIIAAIFRDSLVSLIGFPEKYKNWIFFIPVSTFLFSSYQMINYWLTRKGAFRSIATNKIIRRSFEGTTQSGFGFLATNKGLIFGDIIGNIVNILSGIKQASKNGFTFKGVSPTHIKFSLKRYRNFPKYQALPALLNTASILLPIFLINKYFSHDTAGYFDLSRQILAVPIAFITAALSQVLLKDYSGRIIKKQKLKTNILKTAGLLSVLILPFLILIMLFGEELFGFVFSPVWTQSGAFSAILVPAFAIQFIVSPLSISFTVLEELKILAIWQITYFLLISCLYFFTGLSIEKFLIIFTIINILSYLIYFILILHVCNKYDKTI
ncbi:MAG: oligosaccharide flippase family protein [Bacteroidales bacterium]|nr:oligosaccharide flippase family protein [Bacteroidales bacterium]